MDELLGKKVPFSAQAEQAVIGSVLIDPDCIPSVMERLRADEFYGKLNRDIYDTVYSMFAYGMTVDPVTVLGQMRVRGVYQDNCEQYMAEVMRMTPTAANVLEYAAIVRDRALLRRLGETADEINQMVGEGTGYANLTYTFSLNSEEYGVGFRTGSDLTEALNAFFAGAYADGSMMGVAETYGVQAAIIPQA